jgi:hypothetical protein
MKRACQPCWQGSSCAAEGRPQGLARVRAPGPMPLLDQHTQWGLAGYESKDALACSRVNVDSGHVVHNATDLHGGVLEHMAQEGSFPCGVQEGNT